MQYNKAQVYLTTCTHPEYIGLKYIGLDTKRDNNYLGSSIVLRWFISFLGRSYFKKEILSEVTGSMSVCCAEEQKYILQYDAVKDPNYLNMSGGRGSNQTVGTIDLQYVVTPSTIISKSWMSVINKEIISAIHFYSFSRGQLASRILCILVYSYLKNGQETFEYSPFSNYGGCTAEAVEDVVSCLNTLGYVESAGHCITITNKLIDSTPDLLDHGDFTSTTRS